MFKMSIPRISNEEIKKRYEQIKPVVTVNGKLHYLKTFTYAEIVGCSYLWKLDVDVREEVGENELEVLEGKDFVCLHTYGHSKPFKPSILEVLSKIDELDLPFVKAFEIIDSPRTLNDCLKDSFTSMVL